MPEISQCASSRSATLASMPPMSASQNGAVSARRAIQIPETQRDEADEQRQEIGIVNNEAEPDSTQR
jgi:hypothetical protein